MGMCFGIGNRVARWHISKPKFPIWVNFGGSCNVGIFYGHLVDFTAIWYTYIVVVWKIIWLFGIFFPFWYFVTIKIWQP
jgi:hypothetical protein